MIEINGTAHFILTVSQFDKAREFYCELLPFLGLTKVYDGNNFVYHVGGRTAVGIQRCAPEYEGERFVQNRVGLHHACLRARSREDIDAVAAKLREMGAYIDRGPIDADAVLPLGAGIEGEGLIHHEADDLIDRDWRIYSELLRDPAGSERRIEP